MEQTEVRENKHPLCNCNECPYYDQPFVPSTIPEGAQVAVVGEAPGRQEARQGAPFVGSSGQLLRQVLTHVGVPEARVALLNTVACRPPENETPTKSSISCCSGRLESELTGMETIVPVGVVASSAVMGRAVKITKERVGKPKTSKLYPGSRIIPTWHPAACIRTPDYFPSFLKDMGKITDTAPGTWKTPQHIVIGPERAAWAVKQLVARFNRFIIDIETAYEKEGTFVQANHYELLCIGVAFSQDRVLVFDREACSDEAFRQEFKILLETSEIVAHNGKFDLSGLRRIGNAKLSGDTMLASYVLDERSGIHDLGHVSSEWLGAPDFKHVLDPYLGKDKSYAGVPRHILHKYCAFDCGAEAQLDVTLQKAIDKQGSRQLYEYLIAASNVLMEIEMEGMGLNLDVLYAAETELTEELDRLHKILEPWLWKGSQHLEKKKQPKKISANSWLQVQRAIYKHTGIFTKSTDKAHIEDLIEHGVLADGYLQILLEYRSAQKLYGTYVKGIKTRMFDSRIHTSFLLHGTVTGRLSSRNPNLHNIPRDK